MLQRLSLGSGSGSRRRCPYRGDRRDAVLCGCAGGRRVRGSGEGSDPAVSRKPEPEDSGA